MIQNMIEISDSNEFPKRINTPKQDDVNDITAIPSNGTEYQIIKHF